MIGMAAMIFDEAGARIFRTGPARDSENLKGARRVSRVATLDGGVSVSDMGYSHGDRDFKIREPQASLDALEFARRMVEVYQTVIITADDGAYIAVPKGFSVVNNELIVELLITEKISE
jgi:hypothetical protein